ncbi:MAG TPA: flagellar protein FlaG [Holophagaceae bacterium]|nr:flagellar protein FlaG [Holophagaceae bacterium]
MADQVNPLGGLMPGVTQSVPSIPVSPHPASIPTPKAPVSAGGKEGVRSGSEKAPSKESLEAAAKTVEGFIQQSPSDLKFMVDKSTGQYYFKIVDSVTHEVIRQVPSEEVLTMARRLQEISDPKGARGVLVDAEG